MDFLEYNSADIQELDLIFFRGKDFISTAILEVEKITTGENQWSHVGLVVSKKLLPLVEQLKPGRLYIWESVLSSNFIMGTDGILDVETSKGFFGSQLRDLKDVVRAYNENCGKVGLSRLINNPWKDEHQRPRIISLFSKLHKDYCHAPFDVNPLGCLGSAFRCLRPGRNFLDVLVFQENYEQILADKIEEYNDVQILSDKIEEHNDVKNLETNTLLSKGSSKLNIDIESSEVESSTENLELSSLEIASSESSETEDTGNTETESSETDSTFDHETIQTSQIIETETTTQPTTQNHEIQIVTLEPNVETIQIQTLSGTKITEFQVKPDIIQIGDPVIVDNKSSSSECKLESVVTAIQDSSFVSKQYMKKESGKIRTFKAIKNYNHNDIRTVQKRARKTKNLAEIALGSKFNFPRDIDMALFCSEMIALFFVLTGIIDRNIDPRDVIPVDFYSGKDQEGLKPVSENPIPLIV